MRSDIDKSSVAYRIFDFLTTEQGQAIVDESGYVPLQTTTGIRAFGCETAELEYSNHAINISSPALPQRTEIVDLSGKTVFRSVMSSRSLSIPLELCGLHIIKVWLDKNVILHKKIEF